MEVHPKIVQELLGHSNISMTLDTYSHVLPSLQAEAVSRLNALLSAEENPVAVSTAVTGEKKAKNRRVKNIKPAAGAGL